MPQFDFSSNKNLLFAFCVYFVIFIYSFMAIYNSALKIINFNKFIILNEKLLLLFFKKLNLLINLEKQNIIVAINNIKL